MTIRGKFTIIRVKARTNLYQDFFVPNPLFPKKNVYLPMVLHVNMYYSCII